MAKLMSKSELVQKIADQHSNGLSRKDIKGVIESLASVGYKELKKTALESRPMSSAKNSENSKATVETSG
jgi:hypothetical protein